MKKANLSILKFLNPVKNFSTNIKYFDERAKLKQHLYSTNLKDIDSVIKTLHNLPEETDQIINEYLDKDFIHYAIEIFSHQKKISMNTYKKLEKSLDRTFIMFFLREYLEGNQEFQQLFEFIVEENVFVVNKILNVLCEKGKFKECFFVLNHFKFDKNLISHMMESNVKNMTHYLKEINNNANLNVTDRDSFITFLKSYTNLIKFENEDLLAPYNEFDNNNIKLNIEETKIHYIDNIEELTQKLEKLFKDSEYLGVDNEWKPYSNSGSKIISVMQVADLKNVVLIDMLKIEQNENFIQTLKNIFKNKNLLTNSFSHDLAIYTPILKEYFLKECNILDIKNMYNPNREGKFKSLKQICSEVFNKEICKKEQCSNWEVRPLRQRQVHYAALDAYIIVKLYSNLNKI